MDNKLIDLNAYPVNLVLKQLLKDKTTRDNIMFCTDSYILGFSDEISIEKHNLRQLDALPYAKEGTLELSKTMLYFK